MIAAADRDCMTVVALQKLSLQPATRGGLAVSDRLEGGFPHLRPDPIIDRRSSLPFISASPITFKVTDSRLFGDLGPYGD